MQLKCPKCEERIEFDPEQSDHATCPKCAARLRLRRGTASSSSGSQSEASSPGPARVPEITLAPGTKLGGFEIRKIIGRGGMAIVYRGVQLSLNRPVAIKVLAPRFAKNKSFVDRFDREAGALANLNHPNIVNIIDKGVVDDNYYFVMELVEGITLDQLLQTVELNERHYTHIISEIAKALSYVHSRGIIHRDIKPSNVLVNKHGMVKVSDFGIAHITDAALPPERFGKSATVGTANYMAPEQAENPGAVDKRADIYSLGVTFYKMLAKKLPVGDFKGASVLNPKIPRTVDAVLAKAMERDPARRYQTVQELCDALLPLFQPAQAGAKGSPMADGEAFLFNPTFMSSGAGGANKDDTSSVSLFVPAQWQAGGTPPLGTARPGSSDGVEESEPRLQEESESDARQKVIQWVAVAVAILAIISVFAAYWLWKVFFVV